jgi:hypothetical protein
MPQRVPHVVLSDDQVQGPASAQLRCEQREEADEPLEVLDDADMAGHTRWPVLT